MVDRAGALRYWGDAQRAAMGAKLIERVIATGSLVIRKVGATRAGELAIHRFLSAPSVTCKDMLGTLAGTVRWATLCESPIDVVGLENTEVVLAECA